MSGNRIVPIVLMAAVLLSTAFTAMGAAPQPVDAAPLVQTQPEVPPYNALYVKVQGPLVALTNVRVIDGTGADPLEDQTILIRDDKIEAIGATEDVEIPAAAEILDLGGYTVLPGFVGMHEHLFYVMGGGSSPSDPPLQAEMGFSFPRLYLANGVTSMRTTGSIEFFTDAEIKRRIDAGEMIGPKIHLTAPYLEGQGSPIATLHQLSGPDDARRMVNFYAKEGATSFKVYNYITAKSFRPLSRKHTSAV
jgi:hypothetical protein